MDELDLIHKAGPATEIPADETTWPAWLAAQGLAVDGPTDDDFAAWDASTSGQAFPDGD